MKPTVKELLFGTSSNPDEIDAMIDEERAGLEGATTHYQIVERLIGRELTLTEVNLVNLAKEVIKGNRACPMELVDLVEAGLAVDSGRRRRGRIVWVLHEFAGKGNGAEITVPTMTSSKH
jgi:hypothetical protein